MGAEFRVVIDTNVFISQLLMPKSIPAAVVRLVLRRGTVLSSAEHLRELFDVAMRPKFDAYASREVRIEQVRRLAELVEPVQIIRRINRCRDPKDNMLLEIAANGRASCIVTGDDDLLTLHPFEGVMIVKPFDFLRTTAV
jgi:putative PIN family toxin of toxin-antitoxin system